MGKKSAAKKKTQKKPAQRADQISAPETMSGPSLVQSSASFVPKTKPSEDLLQVRRGDVRRIGILLAVMAAIFIGLGLSAHRSAWFDRAGTKISHSLGF